MTRNARITWIGIAVLLVLIALGAWWFQSQRVTINVYVPSKMEERIAGDEPAASEPDMAPTNVLARPPDITPPATQAPKQEVPPDIDTLLARMAWGNIAFNAPETLNLKQTSVIQLLLSATAAIEELQQQLTAPGAQDGAHIQIADRMEAHLAGAEFDITAITPETQAVTRTQNTEWKWEIKPRNSGTHTLHLTLSALVTVNGETTPRTIKNFDRDIVIQVTSAQRAVAFVYANWQWLWATLLVPLATWWWNRRRRHAAL